jgi:hypothetical protein
LNASTIELIRNINAAICGLAVGYVVFDSFAKRADVPGLKRELNLRRSQLVAKIVDDIEKAVEPLLTADRTTYDLEDGVVSPPLAILDESTRSALTYVIKRNDDAFADIRLSTKLPIHIQLLNTLVYWTVLIAAVLSAVCAVILTWADTTPSHLWVFLVLPGSVVAATVAMAGVRHLKVQNAEKQILKNDS